MWNAFTVFKPLLNHTAQKIIKFTTPQKAEDYELICKWGLDGSGSHTQYKQVFQVNDGNIVCTLMVPLRLWNKNTGIDVWKNPKPSSSRFCWPITLQWIVENKYKIIAEEKKILDQMKKLNSWNIYPYNIEYKLLMTMIDGKVNKY